MALTLQQFSDDLSIGDCVMRMRAAIAKALHIDEGFVNMKATTLEGLGAIGQGQGIAAFAAVVLTKEKQA